MSRYFCWNDLEHERQAREDARYGRRDYDMYDRYTSDPCKEVYTEEFDRERRAIERREEERAEEQRMEERAAMRRAEERREHEYYEAEYYAQQERDYYASMQAQQEQPQEPSP